MHVISGPFFAIDTWRANDASPQLSTDCTYTGTGDMNDNSTRT